MYARLGLAALGLALLAPQTLVSAQGGDRLNPMIALHEKGLPIFGIAHPGLTAGRGGRGGRGGATGTAAAGAETPPPPPPPAPVLSDVARETVGYKLADYHNTSGAPEVFLQYMVEMKKAGGSVKTNPFLAKIPIWHRNPETSAAAIVRQLNAGHVGVTMQSVEAPEEIRETIKAMRFASAGGTRPDAGYDAAAAYWGISPQQYRQKADVWPLNRAGELVVHVIIESRPGLANLQKIAAEPGIAALWVGYGTLGGVFSGDPAGREAASQQVLAACKQFKIPCGFPTNNPAEIEQRMKEGWSVFVMQSRNAAGFAAVETGRKLSGR